MLKLHDKPRQTFDENEKQHLVNELHHIRLCQVELVKKARLYCNELCE